MPIVNNDFSRFENSEGAAKSACNAVGTAIYQAAMPMCPVDTGNLRRSHAVKVQDSGEYVDVGVTADYGGYVHNGTSRMKPRPWLKQAVQQNRSSLGNIAAQAYRGAL